MPSLFSKKPKDKRPLPGRTKRPITFIFLVNLFNGMLVKEPVLKLHILIVTSIKRTLRSIHTIDFKT